MCDGDQSYCMCHVNGEPVRVPIPDPVNDDSYERDLRAGKIILLYFHYTHQYIAFPYSQIEVNTN